MSDDDFKFEPVRGLPETLPDDERMIWQGAPEWTQVARRIYHADKVALYFVLLSGWRMVTELSAGRGFWSALLAGAWLALPGCVAVGLLALVAWATSRTTVYTVTNKRIVMRIGIALPVTFNLPYAKMIRADLAVRKDGSGDIVTTLVPGERIAYLVLWPHLRPWSVSQPQPALRCIPDARRVGALLGVALSSAPVIRVRMPNVAMADAGERGQFGAGGQLSAAE